MTLFGSGGAALAAESSAAARTAEPMHAAPAPPPKHAKLKRAAPKRAEPALAEAETTPLAAAPAADGEPPAAAAREAAAPPAAAPRPTTADGTAAYYVPNKMIAKAPSSVSLWIDPAMPVRQLQEQLAQQLKLDLDHIKFRLGRAASGETVAAGDVQGLTSVRVGDKMFAQVIGNDFEITPSEPTPGEVDGSTWKWQWQVTPRRASGSRPLLLTIKAWIDEGARKTSMPSINEPVIVQADRSWTERLGDWTGLLNAINDFYKALAALAVTAAGLVVIFRKRLRSLLRRKRG